LKTGIQLHGAYVVTDIWKTCCGLQNWCVFSCACNFWLFFLSFSLCMFCDFGPVFTALFAFFSVRLLKIDGLDENWESGVPSD
jgi:hypothetical protein